MMTSTDTQLDLNSIAKEIIEIEANAIYKLKDSLGQSFTKALELILDTSGRVIVMGIGKSGHIANKIAATLASTGTPAFFVHPSEAQHGDMGMITQNDIILLLSNSGETDEIISLLPQLKRLNLPIISITGNTYSTIAKIATVNLTLPIEKEACPLGLAPTTSTTAMLVMGDAIAITLLKIRGITSQDFAQLHPGGTLGKRLTLTVESRMHQDSSIPKVSENTLISEALIEMTQKRLGITAIVDSQNRPIGIYTDGDLRRTLSKNLDIHQTSIDKVMTTTFKTTKPDTLLFDALKIMETYKITTLLITNNQDILIGVIHLHDILSTT